MVLERQRVVALPDLGLRGVLAESQHGVVVGVGPDVVAGSPPRPRRCRTAVRTGLVAAATATRRVQRARVLVRVEEQLVGGARQIAALDIQRLDALRLGVALL